MDDAESSTGQDTAADQGIDAKYPTESPCLQMNQKNKREHMQNE